MFLQQVDLLQRSEFLIVLLISGILIGDILNVRLQTLGVMEHSFPISMGGVTYNWKIYDVGGAVSFNLNLLIPVPFALYVEQLALGGLFLRLC